MNELTQLNDVLENNTGEKSPALVLSLLSNERRMLVIEALSGNDCSTIREVADRIAREETDGDPGSSERKKYYISLYQCHMPKMDDAGIVEWDKRSGEVQPGENYEHVRSILNNVLSMY